MMKNARLLTQLQKRGAADSPYKIVERDSVVYGFTDDVPSLQKSLKQRGLLAMKWDSLQPRA